MLKQMREGAKSTVLKLVLFGLLLLAMTGLALMDVQGMFRRGFSNDTIASFGHDKLKAAEFDRMVQSAVRAQHMKQSAAYRAGLPQQVLKQEIDGRLFSMSVNDLGLVIEDSLVANQIKETLAPLVSKGMLEKDALQRLLQVYGVSEGQFVASMKSQLATQLLMSTIVGGAHAPQQLVDDALKYTHEWRRGEYFLLTAEDVGALQPPSETALKSYYDTIAHDYALPEYRTLSVLVLDKKALGDAVKISDEKLKQYYDENSADYKTPEKRVVSQVIAADEATAKQIYTAAEKDKNLQAAAKGKGNFIKAETYAEKEMPSEISKTAFAGADGAILAPVKSPLGWHILHIEKVIPAASKSFKSVKADIEKELSQDSVSEVLYKRANKINDDIAGGRSVSDVAKENNLSEMLLEKIDVHGIGANNQKPAVTPPLYEKVLETGFNLKKGSASPLIETPDGAFIIVGVNEIFPSDQQSFDKVRDRVLSRWKTENQAKALSSKATKIVERLKQGEDFSKIAAEFKKSVQSTALVQRGTPAAQAKMDKNMMSALFSIGKTGQAAAVSGDNAVTLIRLAERKVLPAKDISPQDVATMEATINRALQQDLFEQYRTSLIAKYNVDINDKLMKDMYTPKDDSGDTVPGEE